MIYLMQVACTCVEVVQQENSSILATHTCSGRLRPACSRTCTRKVATGAVMLQQQQPQTGHVVCSPVVVCDRSALGSVTFPRLLQVVVVDVLVVLVVRS